MHTFDVFAKPADSKNSDLFKVFTYVINVAEGNLKWEAYPKTFSGWSDGCETSLREAKVDEGEVKDVEVRVPGAADVAFISSDGEWTHLEKVTITTSKSLHCEQYLMYLRWFHL